MPEGSRESHRRKASHVEDDDRTLPAALARFPRLGFGMDWFMHEEA
jgi:hypothetical protein